MPAFNIESNRAFDNYDELVAAINDWMDRDDLTGVAGQMIALAEDEMIMALEPYFQETSTSLTTDITGYSALPANFKRPKRVLYDGCPVPQRGVSGIDRMTDDVSRPWAYTLERGGLRVWPAAVHTVSLLYQPRLERLTDGNPTNNLLDDFPSVYFYGAMTFAHGYVADFGTAESVYRPMFQRALADVRDYYIRQRTSGPMAARASFVP